jgi:MFS family permease
MSAIVGTDQYVNYFNNPHGLVQGAIGSSLAAGSVIGAIMAGPISDKYGRRDAIAFACLWWLVGTAVQVSTHGTGQLIAGRIINGVCVGITSSQVPVYLAEIAQKDVRGSIVVIQQLAIEFGILVMYFIGYGCSFIDNKNKGSTSSFRVAWAMQFIPAIFLLIGIPFLPRSPRWLAKVGRTEEAIQILANIQSGGNKDDPLVVAEWEEITTMLAAERAGVQGWRKFTANGMWRRTFAGASVQAWQQLRLVYFQTLVSVANAVYYSGANVMVYYMVYVFSMAGLHG